MHARDAESGDDAGGEERRPAGTAVADGEDADGDDDDRDGEADQGERHVVADGRLVHGEAEHRDEVHGPDAAADGGGAEREPAGLPRLAALAQRPGGAAQPEGAAEAGDEIGGDRGDQTVAESVHGALHVRCASHVQLL
ncbi:hypothetical protein GCM10018771_71060 [Streptomyces cellulosae]|nr:hypothetical protein GCM10018771_71060 [Streptomyces cellulosae]